MDDPLNEHLGNHARVLKHEKENKDSISWSFDKARILLDQYNTINKLEKNISERIEKIIYKNSDDDIEKNKGEIISIIENILKHYNK